MDNQTKTSAGARAAKQIKTLVLIAVIALSSTGCAQAQSPADVERANAIALYHQVWQLTKDNFIEPKTLADAQWDSLEHKHDAVIKNMDDAKVEIDSILAKLSDRYTRFLDKDAASEQNTALQGATGGIGAQLVADRAGAKITAVVVGSPAATQGVQPEDIITAINGTSAKDKTLEEITHMIRGDVGTSVKLTILHKGKSKALSVVRQEIDLSPVVARKLPGNIGYIRVENFMGQNTAKKFHAALFSFQNTSGLIVDLRENPGGLLGNALNMASYCVAPGSKLIIVATRDGNNVSEDTTWSPSNALDLLGNKPIVILANGDSASASEVFTGTLMDDKHAILVGSKTFGKGCVQNVFKDGLQSRELNVTIAHYFSPNRNWPGDGGSRRIGYSPRKENTVEPTRAQLKQMHFAANVIGQGSQPDLVNDPVLLRGINAIKERLGQPVKK